MRCTEGLGRLVAHPAHLFLASGILSSWDDPFGAKQCLRGRWDDSDKMNRSSFSLFAIILGLCVCVCSAVVEVS